MIRNAEHRAPDDHSPERFNATLSIRGDFDVDAVLAAAGPVRDHAVWRGVDVLAYRPGR